MEPVARKININQWWAWRGVIKWVIVHRESQIKCRWWLAVAEHRPGQQKLAGLGWL